MTKKQTQILAAMTERGVTRHWTANDVASLIGEAGGRSVAPALRSMETRGLVHSHFNAFINATYYGVDGEGEHC